MTAHLNAACRLALAAFLHDLGKFAERARLPAAQERDARGNTRQAVNELLYCPQFKGQRTHVHAAYTAIGLDLLEQHLPDLVGAEMTPFAAWREKNADDSLINAAAKHHRPETYLQWVIATADRLASGFERETFARYNAAPDDPQQKLNHYTTRQETLLEGIRLAPRPDSDSRAWRYPLKPLAPETLFPVSAATCEHGDKKKAQQEYQQLWDAFHQGLADIPESHRVSLPLWLDHFDSLWLTFTHAIPSATAGIGGPVRPNVALYDHSKTTAALAVALWRYHTDQGHDANSVQEALRAQWDRERANAETSRRAWEDQKFLLIQGDFFGIQNFIFAEGSITQKHAAKLMRGRSFYVSLLTELAALKVLEALDLPATSQVVNAAGKFLIVAPNTPETVAALQGVQAELDAWFLQHTYGQSGIGMAWLPAASQDFKQGKGDASPFRELIQRLFANLETAKLQRLGLCSNMPAPAVFTGFLDRFTQGECQIDGRSPAEVKRNGVLLSPLAADQIETGHCLATSDRVLVTHTALNHHTLRLPIFGYYVNFTAHEEATGKFGPEVRSGNLVRAWDFSLPTSATAALWNGYARRAINAYVPRFGTVNAWEAERYRGIETPEDFEPHPNEPKTLNHLARDDRHLDDTQQRWIGVEALMTLKGDVDNLGQIFQQGLTQPTFAKVAALSRQMNAFFTVYLPWLCQEEFPNTYTVFAGGDDFFLIGPWHSTLKLAQRMRTAFRRYVAENPEIHFSAGLSMTKPGLPIRQLAALAEDALDTAKQQPGKNAVTCFDLGVPWDKFERLMQRATGLERVAQDHALSTSYLYSLLRYTELASQEQQNPQNALWHSQFAYSTRRLAERRYKDRADEAKRRAMQQTLATEIYAGIQQHRASYQIALFTYLYQQRD